MTPQVHIPNATSRGVIASLRSPCAQNVTLKSGYSSNGPRNLGQVLVLPSVSEPVTAPANGIVVSINRKPNTGWTHSAGDLDSHQTLEIKFDHGGSVFSSIHGLASVTVPVGQYVTRGDTIGAAKTTEVFFQLFYRQSPLDPATYSTFFRGYDGGKVPGKARKLRAGPDFIVRAVSDTVSYLLGGIRYFVDKYCTKPPLLVNVDFNGGGSKSGLGVVGFESDDHWNVYTPTEFSSTDSYSCYFMLNPALVVSALATEVMDSVVSWVSGTMAVVALIGTGTESATSSATWLAGSTETVPEIGAIDHTWSFLSGGTEEFILVTSASASGTNTVAFSSGSIFDVVVFAFGSYAPTLGIPYVESAGTASVAFLSGGTAEIVLPGYSVEASTGTVAFFSGSIYQF